MAVADAFGGGALCPADRQRCRPLTNLVKQLRKREQVCPPATRPGPQNFINWLMMKTQHTVPPLYRGFKNSQNAMIFDNPYLKVPRRPLDSSEQDHEEADDWFFKKFNIRYRSSTLFCTGNKEMAAEYGEVFTLEPLDPENCLCCWSPKFSDFYNGVRWPEFKGLSISQVLERVGYREFRWNDTVHRAEAALSGHEIMVWSPRYVIELSQKR